MSIKGIGYIENRHGVWLARWTVAGKRYSRSTGIAIPADGEKAIKAARKAAEAKLREFTAPYSDRNEKVILERQVARLKSVDEDIARREAMLPSITLENGWGAYVRSQSRPRSGGDTLHNYEMTYGQFVRWIKEAHPCVSEMRNVTRGIAEEYAAFLMMGTNKDTVREIQDCRKWLKREKQQARRGRPITLTEDEQDAVDGIRKTAKMEIREPVRGNTFNKHMNALALIWRHVARNPEARITVNPWTYDKETGEGIRRVKLTHEERPHSRRDMTVEEVQRLLDKADGEMKALVAIGFYTGMRLGDGATLMWENFDKAKGTITKRSRKTDTETSPAIHPALMRILKETVGVRDTGYVVPNIAKRYLGTHSERVGVSQDITAMFESVGLHTKTEEDGRRRRNDCGFHSLRHTFVTMIRGCGAELRTAQELAGHRTSAMTEHYTHDNARAVLSLPDIAPVADGRGDAKQARNEADEAILEKIKGISKEDLLRVLGSLPS